MLGNRVLETLAHHVLVLAQELSLFQPWRLAVRPRANASSRFFFTMVLGGLWHGASVIFIVWGAMQGLALALERLFNYGNKTEREPFSRRPPDYTHLRVYHVELDRIPLGLARGRRKISLCRAQLCPTSYAPDPARDRSSRAGPCHARPCPAVLATRALPRTCTFPLP